MKDLREWVNVGSNNLGGVSTREEISVKRMRKGGKTSLMDNFIQSKVIGSLEESCFYYRGFEALMKSR